MGYHVKVGNTTRVDIARAKSIIGLVGSLNDTVKDELTTLIAEFYTVWADDIAGNVNFDDEAVKVGRALKKITASYPDDIGDISNAFCLAIRTEMNRVEDTLFSSEPVNAPNTTDAQSFADWLIVQGHTRELAIANLLWGNLPPAHKVAAGVFTSPRYKALYSQHKIKATVTLYQYAREFYEAHTPKQFAVRPSLPAYYTAAPASIQLSTFTAIEMPAIAVDTDAGPFPSLLLNYSLAELNTLLAELGLLSATTGYSTPAATSGAWVGVIYALLEAKPARLTGTKAAIWRAFSETFKAKGSGRTVQNGLGKRGSIAEQFKDRALGILNK